MRLPSTVPASRTTSTDLDAAPSEQRKRGDGLVGRGKGSPLRKGEGSKPSWTEPPTALRQIKSSDRQLTSGGLSYVLCLPGSAGILRWSSSSSLLVCGRGVLSKAERAPPSITSGCTAWARSASF